MALLYISGALTFLFPGRSGALRVFGFEIESYQYGRWWSSMLYQFDRFPVGAATAALGILVAFANLRNPVSRTASARRTAALLTGTFGIIFLVAWGIIGQFDVLANQLRHVRLFYVELPLLPFYALFAAVGVSRGLEVITSRFPKPELAQDSMVILTMVTLVLPRLHDIVTQSLSSAPLRRQSRHS